MGKTRRVKFGDIVLPVNPAEITLSMPMLNQKATLLNMGSVNLAGNRDLTTAELSSFFPGSRSPFRRFADREPKQYIQALQAVQQQKTAKRLIITDLDLNLAMLIDGLEVMVREGSGDIDYTLKLSEYRTLNVPAVSQPLAVKDNGLKDRPDAAQTPKTYTVVSGDNLWSIAKRMYGDGGKNTVIYQANREVIEAAAKKYGKSSSKNGWWIYPGTQLTIP